MLRALTFSLLLLVATSAALPTFAEVTSADDTKAADAKTEEASPAEAVAAAKAAAAQAAAKKGKTAPHLALLKEAKKHEGLITLYQKDAKLFAELKPGNYNKDYMVLAAIARGVARGRLLAGMSWGEDTIWQFRKVEKRVHVVRRNLRYRAKAGSPIEKAVKLAYTDSVLFSLPIVTKGPSGGDLIDFSAIFMTDLPQISQVMPGYTFSKTKSSWASVKTFKGNVELQIAATYASSGRDFLPSVPDSRGVTLNIHYSISQMPKTGYKPRLADDRVGYFVRAIRDFSKDESEDRFVRYIERWHLAKADPVAKASPPKQPIIFWIEKTVPFRYRRTVREGILEWNKAFEAAGFIDAIEVRQQPNDATWDPEDINYNTFRWITSGDAFAMGPSRVDPRTGQILDSDILFDSDFLRYWKESFETTTPKPADPKSANPLNLKSHAQNPVAGAPANCLGDYCFCQFHQGMARELALGSAVMSSRTATPEEMEKLITQGLKEVVMHEVGHTLGLRHNFKASTYLSMADLNDTEQTDKTGLTASVMDYSPANIMPSTQKQGDYFSQVIGPYDKWAIEYGYKNVPGGSPEGEVKELNKIAARSGEPALAYSTDEDTRGVDPDPHSNRFDLGSDVVEFATLRAELVREQWPDIIDRVVKEGEGYERARRAVGILLASHGTSMGYASRYVGGVYVSRSHKGDKDAKAPYVVVDAEKQRASLDLLAKEVFSDKPYSLPPELYNHISTNRWYHWGVNLRERTDYPVHDVILMWQDRTLSQLLSSVTLSRLHDSELKVPADQDAFTAAELLERLTAAIFAEVDSLEPGEYTNRKPAISSIRRNIQRRYYEHLGEMVLGRTYVPTDCQSVASYQLTELRAKIEKLLNSNIEFDSYSRAHLSDLAQRIDKVHQARLNLLQP